MEAEFYFIINGFVAVIRPISAVALFTPTLTPANNYQR